jgi:hypothetical protein
MQYAVRLVPWRQLGGALALCGVLLVTGVPKADSTAELLPLMRTVTLTLACTAAFAVHDPAGTVTEATRQGRCRLRTAAGALAFLPVAGAWLGMMLVPGAAGGPSFTSIVPGLFVELTALFAVGLAIAAAHGARNAYGSSGALERGDARRHHPGDGRSRVDPRLAVDRSRPALAACARAVGRAGDLGTGDLPAAEPRPGAARAARLTVNRHRHTARQRAQAPR